MIQYILTETDIKKLHGVELELLKEFDRICRKYNILYSIDGGTLLGAIRHKGFIPWDDDADVIMTRREYNKFIGVVFSELNKEFYLQDMAHTDGYRWGYAKLRKRNTAFVRLGQEHMPYEQGIFLDIFVCDNVPENYCLRVLCAYNSFLFRKIFYSPVGMVNEKGFLKYWYRFLNLIPESILKNMYYKYIDFRNNFSSQWVKCLTFPSCNNTFGYKREWYEDTIELEFEGIVLMGAKKYDEYLTFLYGNYMELPPESKRKVHPVSKFFCYD